MGEMIVEVEKHTSCACGCKIKADVNYSSGLCCIIDKSLSFFSLVGFLQHCNVKQYYQPSLCRCECMDKNEVCISFFFLVIFPDFLFRNHCAKLVLMIDFGTLINVNADAKMKSTVRLA